MLKAYKSLVVLVLLAGASAHATLLTDLAGVQATAGSCYFGCGNASYDASNILDHDFGFSGNTGLNSWNSGYYGGYVQVDFLGAYSLERIQVYGASNGAGRYTEPFVLTGSLDGVNWFSVSAGSYHNAPTLTHSDVLGGIKYGADFNVDNSTLAADITTRYLRYTVGPGTPEWGYMFEMVVDGHAPVSGTEAVPEPQSIALMALGLAFLALAYRRKSLGSLR